jgi:23S rRNA (guanosine2251-2'-O)-methyltransferase
MKNRKLKNSELGRKQIDQLKELSKTPLILILDDVRSLHNIGSVFRSADAFLIEKIYLCGITATPPHKDIHKTALGATDSVGWEYRKDAVGLIKELQNEGITVFAIEQTQNSLFLQDFQPVASGKTAFVLGNEVKGVAQAVIDAAGQVIEIPQIGVKHSLNIAVAAGVVCWDFFQKLQTKKPE